jgi:hypothetical protein
VAPQATRLGPQAQRSHDAEDTSTREICPFDAIGRRRQHIEPNPATDAVAYQYVVHSSLSTIRTTLPIPESLQHGQQWECGGPTGLGSM